MLDDDGYLRITDRNKDMIVLSGGENISPAKVEGMPTAEPEVSQAVVAGDGRCHPPPWSCRRRDMTMLAQHWLYAVNHRLSVTERIRKHAVVDAFTVENGLDADEQNSPIAGDPREYPTNDEKPHG